MSTNRNPSERYYRAVCRHRGPGDSNAAWRRVAVVVANVESAQEAADNACLYLIWDRQGEAEATLVVGSSSKSINVYGGIFDAEEYDEIITFGGTILSAEDCGSFH